MGFLRRADRSAEVARVIIKHGWHPALSYIGLERFVPKELRGQGPAVLSARAMREALTELGPAFVKVGQFLSSRPDLIPREYVEQLEKLQDRGEPVPAETVRRVIESEMGGPPEEVFQSFDFEPLASASIGQVHRARLAGVGDVAVKVQRPGVAQVIETDLELLFFFARRLQRALPTIGCRYDLMTLAEDLARYLREELDYTHEGHNAERLQQNLEPLGTVTIPRVHWEHSTSKVLVTEYVEGTKVTDLDAVERLGVDKKRVAARIAQVMLRQIYIDGFFHGDPHPGNILVFEDERVGFLDFGLVGRIDEHSRQLLTDMLVATERMDSPRFADSFLSLCRHVEHVDHAAFTADVEAILRKYQTRPEEGRVGMVLRDSLRLVWQHGLSIPGEVALLVKVFILFEGICRRLDPEFDLIRAGQDVLLAAAAKRFHPKVLMEAALDAGLDLVDLLLRSPRELKDLLSKAAHGQLSVNIQHRGLRDFTRELERSFNRVAYALVVSASIVGSSILTQANVGPKIHDYPLLGLAAFLVSGVLGFILLWNILMSGRLR